MAPWIAVPQQSGLCGYRGWSTWLRNPDHWRDHYNGKIRQGNPQHLQDHALTAEEINKDWLPTPASLTPHVSEYRFSLNSTRWFRALTESSRRRSDYFQPKIGQTIHQKINMPYLMYLFLSICSSLGSMHPTHTNESDKPDCGLSAYCMWRVKFESHANVFQYFSY